MHAKAVQHYSLTDVGTSFEEAHAEWLQEGGEEESPRAHDTPVDCDSDGNDAPDDTETSDCDGVGEHRFGKSELSHVRLAPPGQQISHVMCCHCNKLIGKPYLVHHFCDTKQHSLLRSVVQTWTSHKDGVQYRRTKIYGEAFETAWEALELNTQSEDEFETMGTELMSPTLDYYANTSPFSGEIDTTAEALDTHTQSEYDVKEMKSEEHDSPEPDDARSEPHAGVIATQPPEASHANPKFQIAQNNDIAAVLQSTKLGATSKARPPTPNVSSHDTDAELMRLIALPTSHAPTTPAGRAHIIDVDNHGSNQHKFLEALGRDLAARLLAATKSQMADTHHTTTTQVANAITNTPSPNTSQNNVPMLQLQQTQIMQAMLQRLEALPTQHTAPASQTGPECVLPTTSLRPEATAITTRTSRNWPLKNGTTIDCTDFITFLQTRRKDDETIKIYTRCIENVFTMVETKFPDGVPFCNIGCAVALQMNGTIADMLRTFLLEPSHGWTPNIIQALMHWTTHLMISCGEKRWLEADRCLGLLQKNWLMPHRIAASKERVPAQLNIEERDTTRRNNLTPIPYRKAAIETAMIDVWACSEVLHNDTATEQQFDVLYAMTVATNHIWFHNGYIGRPGEIEELSEDAANEMVQDAEQNESGEGKLYVIKHKTGKKHGKRGIHVPQGTCKTSKLYLKAPGRHGDKFLVPKNKKSKKVHCHSLLRTSSRLYHPGHTPSTPTLIRKEIISKGHTDTDGEFVKSILSEVNANRVDTAAKFYVVGKAEAQVQKSKACANAFLQGTVPWPSADKLTPEALAASIEKLSSFYSRRVNDDQAADDAGGESNDDGSDDDSSGDNANEDAQPAKKIWATIVEENGDEEVTRDTHDAALQPSVAATKDAIDVKTQEVDTTASTDTNTKKGYPQLPNATTFPIKNKDSQVPTGKQGSSTAAAEIKAWVDKFKNPFNTPPKRTPHHPVALSASSGKRALGGALPGGGSEAKQRKRHRFTAAEKAWIINYVQTKMGGNFLPSKDQLLKQ